MTDRTTPEPLDLLVLSDQLDRAYFLMDASHMACSALTPRDHGNALSEVIAVALQVLGEARDAIEVARKAGETVVCDQLGGSIAGQDIVTAHAARAAATTASATRVTMRTSCCIGVIRLKGK